MIIKKSGILANEVTYHPVLRMENHEGEMYYTIFHLDSYYWGVLETIQLINQSWLSYELIDTDAEFVDGDLKLLQEIAELYRDEYEVCYYHGLSHIVTPNLAKALLFATQEMKRKYVHYSSEEMVQELIIHLAFHLDTQIPQFDERLSYVLQNTKFTLDHKAEMIQLVFTDPNRYLSFFDKRSMRITGVMELISTEYVPYELVFIDGKIEGIYIGMPLHQLVNHGDFIVRTLIEVRVQTKSDLMIPNSQLDVKRILAMIGGVVRFENDAFFENEHFILQANEHIGQYVYSFLAEGEEVSLFTTVQGKLIFSDDTVCTFLLICAATQLVSLTLNFQKPVTLFTSVTQVKDIQFVNTNRTQELALIGAKYNENETVAPCNWFQNLFAIRIYVDGVLQQQRIYSERQKLQFTVMHATSEVSFKRFGRAIETHTIDIRKIQIHYYSKIQHWPTPFIILFILLVNIGFIFTPFYNFGLSFTIISAVMFVMSLIKYFQRSAPIIAIASSKDILGIAAVESVAAHYTFKWLKRK